MKVQSILYFNLKALYHKGRVLAYIVLFFLINTSCIKQLNLYEGDKDEDNGNSDVKEKAVVCETDFFYPFDKEVKSIETTLTIRTRTPLPEDISRLKTEIPPLKYNKSWLFMLTQDDCKQVAFCCTWAAINGYPLSNLYFYDLAHIQADDFPPDSYYLNKTLGCTDGAGNEVRFSFTTTLSPEWEYMNETTKVGKGYTENYHRFFMKSGLFWGNVKEMLNYGVGIAFHDLKVDDPYNEEEVLTHLDIAHSIIVDKLGRDCKMLARPDGNDTYIKAGTRYPSVLTMTTESGGSTLYPYQDTELYKIPVQRSFYAPSPTVSDPRNDPERIKEAILNELSKPEKERMAINVGVHGTDGEWVDFFVWLNDEYGKDGQDNMWMPSQEEYYEYTYYRTHGTVETRRTDDYTLELTVTLPEGMSCYYPAITVNLQNLQTDDILSIDTDENISGFSYADCKEKDCVMLNIDCRKYLAEHAENFVKRHEKHPNVKTYKADALYFVNLLKQSEKKDELLNRIR